LEKAFNLSAPPGNMELRRWYRGKGYQPRSFRISRISSELGLQAGGNLALNSCRQGKRWANISSLSAFNSLTTGLPRRKRVHSQKVAIVISQSLGEDGFGIASTGRDGDHGRCFFIKTRPYCTTARRGEPMCSPKIQGRHAGLPLQHNIIYIICLSLISPIQKQRPLTPHKYFSLVSVNDLP